MSTSAPSLRQRTLRQDIRQQRRELHPAFRREAARQIRRHMAISIRYVRARHVAFFFPTRDELDLWPLVCDSADRGKVCYLPVMTDRLMRFRSSPLAFQAFDPQEKDLVRGNFGIMEPAFNPHEQTRLSRLDVIFVPLIAFDRQGNRVGMGKGYYDRTLAGLANSYRRPWLVGCGFSMQEVEAIPVNAWDVPLDAILTEKGLLCFG